MKVKELPPDADTSLGMIWSPPLRKAWRSCVAIPSRPGFIRHRRR
jgi:hypothetical protein